MSRKPSVSTEEIIELYQRGLSKSEISECLCVNTVTIKRHLEAAGIMFREKRGRKSIVNRLGLTEVCRPPDSCFDCPYPDCIATTTNDLGKRTAAEAEYLLCSGNS